MGHRFVKELLKEKELKEIWIIARRKDRLDAIAEKFPGKIRQLPLDLTADASYRYLLKCLEETEVQVKYLVNAAGAGRMGKFEDISMEDHAFVTDLNVKALTCMTKICLPYMKKGGHIIQLCSGSAFLPQPDFAVYAASKSYVLSFTRALREEVKSRSIYVTAVCPGPVNTEFFKAAGSEVHPSKKRFMAEPEAVVKQAMKDAKAVKELSIYGTSMKLVHLAGKLIPTRVVLSVMNRILSKP